ELSGSKVNERSFTLIGRFVGDSEADLHAKRQELIEELGIDTYPEKQAVRVRFSGATVQKQISAYYTGGLEAQLKVSYGPWQVEGDDAWRNLDYWTEKVAVQFLAPDPMWYEIGESAVLLDTNDSATLRYCTGRLRSTGQWDDLGLTNNPTAGGTIYAITISPDGLVYIGGNFTGWNNEANRDYIAAYDPSTDAWSTVGPGASVNDVVRAL
ncbi:MAG: hypothetical protein GTO22_14230, partial [Gemmatimonadales bacterium]|nr:hypothetical protein [Gemmatimonadales bacterium]